MPPVLAGMAGTEYNSRVDDAAAHTAFSCHSLPPSFSCRHQHQQAATSTVVLLFSASLSLLFTTLGAISPQPSCFSAKTHITAIAPFSFVVPIQPGAERWSKDKRRGRSREASAYRSAESARSLRVNMQNQQRGEQGTDGRKQVVIVPLHKHLQKEGRGMDGDSTAPGLRVFGLEAEAGQELKTGALITLSARSAATVRKRGVRVGAGFRLGNNIDGEWYAVVVQGGKGEGDSDKRERRRGKAKAEEECVVRIGLPLRAPETPPAVRCSLLYAPPKSTARHKILLEKATEIGASVLQPIESHHTDSSGLKISQTPAALHWCLGAVEQSDRMLLPELKTPLPLADACKQAVEAGQKVYICAEPRRGGGRLFLSALIDDHQHAPSSPSPPSAIHGSVAIVIGPEGGWAEGEIDAVKALVPEVSAVALGDGGVLRAETAALSALALWAGFSAWHPLEGEGKEH